MKNLKKLTILYVIVFILSSFIIHIDKWLNSPISHLKNLFYHPLPYHPLLYSFLIFLVISIFIIFIQLLTKLFKKILNNK
ncbi:hypothetical protein [Malaciobacter marinus]|uniref:hypothetical protein n=1 Tax=Malaciobacter marinus TaxID=505249 RepID=UPI0012602951|nr:hypothetical protein [Malaciobacter marinus]